MGPAYAGILGSLAFVVVLVRGALHGSSADSVLMAGIVCLLVFSATGYVAGQVAEQVVRESVRNQFHEEMRNRESNKAAGSRNG